MRVVARLMDGHRELPGMERGNFVHGGFPLSNLTLTTQEWAEEQFGDCQFGDRRRTQRAVTFAAQIANDTSGSTPQQTKNWGACKAAYRLVNRPEVTHVSLGTPHWEHTRERTSGHWLLLGDTTEIEFGIHRQISGLGPTGDGWGRGFFLHSSLLVGAQSEEIIGLSGQELFYRQRRNKKESRHDRVLRKRESEVWGRVIDEVGAPPPEVRFTHVFDRGADNFEVYCHLLLNRVDWVVRACQLKRHLVTFTDTSLKLVDYLASLPEAGSYELTVRKQKQQPARTARVEVRFGMVSMPAPVFRTPWLKTCGIESIVMWVVEVRETNPPPDVKPLRWVLYTSHAITSFEEALCVVGYYEKRTLIEEYHKALKSGCQVETRQYETNRRLEAITGFLAIVAVRLLQLRAVARTNPDQPAQEVVPQLWLDVLPTLRRRPRQSWTVRTFFRELAGLGGFLGRKSDGEPGWQTIWRGFDKLVIALMYAESLKKCG